MKKIIPYISFVLILLSACQSQTEKSKLENPVPGKKYYLKNWQMISSLQEKETGHITGQINYQNPEAIDVEIPTTVLRALVKAGIYPDPHLDLNNFKIPDASDTLNHKLKLEKYSHIKGVDNPFKDPYWFRTVFEVPINAKNKKTWLNFDGINYRADIWINGKKIADAQNVVGMFQRYRFDITPYIKPGEKNILAVKIYQVDHIGTADPGSQLTVFGPQRGWGTEIFKDATLKFSAGWDCAPVVRDRNMGIYQDVYLNYTDPVQILDPYIVTDLPLPDTTRADIRISTVLNNPSDKEIKAVLKGKIRLMNEIDMMGFTKKMKGEMKEIDFEKEISINPHQNINVVFTPSEFKQLQIKNPYLWYPNGSGEQYLHNLQLEAVIDNKISDRKNILFGIREISDSLIKNGDEYGRRFYINGRPVFLRGGWLQPDMMLDMNRKRVYDEARLLAGANVNVLASEDMPSPPDYIMEAYDKYGLLMWETFYQCWTSYPGDPSFANPIDADLAVNDAIDIIRRYRSHPSLLQWTLQCETIVRDEIYSPVRKAVQEMDPTRPFIPTSSIDWDVDKLTPYMKPDLPLGMTDDGAPDYTWYPHAYYYEMIDKVHQQMFRNELGVPSVPTYTSMKKFIFDLGETDQDSIYPLDKNWAHHGAWDDGGYVYKAYDVALRKRYGTPVSAKDYIRKAQYVNAGSYRAMYEAANHKMWDVTQGVMLWKLNSTWPTVVWQIYDWYLNPNSSYYFTKHALEPVHIQLNELNHEVTIINTLPEDLNGLTADIKVLNFDLEPVWKKSIKVDVEKSRYKNLMKIPVIKNLTPVYFVKLNLTKDGKILSDNFYWLSRDKEVNFKDLAKLKKVNLDIRYQSEEKNGEIEYTVIAKNPSKQLAFMNRLMLIDSQTGEEILPSFWSDNYFSLLPGEEKELSLHVSLADTQNKKLKIITDMNE